MTIQPRFEIYRPNFLAVNEFLQYKKNKNTKTNSLGRIKSHLKLFLYFLSDTPLEKAHTLDRRFPQFIQYNSINSIQEQLQVTGYFDFNVNLKNKQLGLKPETQRKSIVTVKDFLKTMKLEKPIQFANIPLRWIDALNPLDKPNKDKPHVYVTLEEMLHIASLEINLDQPRLLRAQASACLLFLGAQRADTHITLPIKAINISEKEIYQWTELGVRTKNNKNKTTFMLNLPKLMSPIIKWDNFVRSNLTENATWFASFDTNKFGSKTTIINSPPGQHRGGILRKDLQRLFRAADLLYKSPHKFRHGFAVYALQGARNMADYHSISQNMMHDNIAVTDEIYAWLNNDKVKKHIAGLSIGANQITKPDNELKGFLNRLSKDDLTKAITIAANELSNR